MKTFDNSAYKNEAKEKWGDTKTHKEYLQKTSNYSADKWQEVNDGLMAIFSKFAECRKNGHFASSDKAQALVEELKAYITENYYTCTKEILSGLGQMYVCDTRFRESIDKSGIGTAEFVSEAIIEYVKGK